MGLMSKTYTVWQIMIKVEVKDDFDFMNDDDFLEVLRAAKKAVESGHPDIESVEFSDLVYSE
jgi:hypothetical protein